MLQTLLTSARPQRDSMASGTSKYAELLEQPKRLSAELVEASH